MKKKSENKYYQLVLNTLLFALGNIGSKFLVFFLMPLYTNELTTTEYGISELVLTGTNLLIPFVSISIQDATLRFALDKKNKSGEVLKNTVFMLMIGTLLTIALNPIIGKYRAISEWSNYFIAITIVYMIRSVLSVYLKSVDKTKLFAIDSVLYTLYLMTFNIVFLSVLKLGLFGYFVAIIISSILSIIQLLIFGNVIKDCVSNKLNMSLLKEMLVFSTPMILNNVSWWIINSSDKVMIEYYDSASASGIYSVAAKIPSIIISLTTIFNQAWIISSVREYDNNKDPNFFSKIFSVFNCMLVLSSSLIVLIIRPFMSIYVGSSFVGCWIFVPFLLLGSIFQSYATFFGAIYTSAKKNVSVMSTTLVAAIINIVLNILLIPRIGVQGAVFATAISYFMVFIFRMYDTQKYIKFSIEYFNVICSIFLLSVQCCIMIKIRSNIVYVLSAILFLTILFVNMNTLKNLITMVLKKINFKNIEDK